MEEIWKKVGRKLIHSDEGSSHDRVCQKRKDSTSMPMATLQSLDLVFHSRRTHNRRDLGESGEKTYAFSTY